MALDMSKELQRRAFYTGRYYERDVPTLVWQITSPGDYFIDIGANIGHVSLLASRRVGPGGQVFAFEPNPDTRLTLITHKVLNGLDALTIHSEALSDVDGEAELHLNRSEPGQCTLRNVSGTLVEKVKLARGDEVLGGLDPARPTIVKIDVEGFEMKVLSGLGAILERPAVAVIAEVTDSWLRQLGSSWSEMRQFMQARGYNAFKVLPVRTWGNPNGIRLVTAREECDPDEQFNVLFVRPDSPFRQRLAKCVFEE